MTRDVGATGEASPASGSPPRQTPGVGLKEDRSYLLFIAAAMASATGGGFLLAIFTSLSAAGIVFEERLPWLVQAHGWAQIQGWAGLFVAGMGLRILPRFAAQKPVPRVMSIAIFAALASGAVIRTVSLLAANGDLAAWGVFAGQMLWGTGAGLFGLATLRVLMRGKGRGQAWHAVAVAGAAWWFGWAVSAIVAGARSLGDDGYSAFPLDDALAWSMMLGAIGNFTWAVQARSVPVFFGRPQPSLRRVAVPATFFNAGILLIFAAGWAESSTAGFRVTGAGMLSAGAGLVLIAPVAGSCWGTATRLRAPARSAAKFVLIANNAALLGGIFLAIAGCLTMVEGEYSAPGLRDAARHALGLGLVTMLVIGMSHLIAPFFALRRVESRSASLADGVVFWLMGSALVSRIAVALLTDHMSSVSRMRIAALSGILAWAGLVTFVVTAVRAIRNEPAVRASMAETIAKSRHSE